MPASRPDNHEQLPPLAAEDYTCSVCALVYPEIAIDDAVGVIVGLPGAVRAVVSAIPTASKSPVRKNRSGTASRRVCR
jgi:hypothetical protein